MRAAWEAVGVVSAPLTLVVKRPDGVEYKRVQSEDEGDGGRSFALPLLPGSATGTWRVEAVADPKADPVGQTSFLVEDYVPERLEFSLNTQTAAARFGAAVEIAAQARYLYGAPGANLEITGEAEIDAADQSLPALKGYAAGLQDESLDSRRRRKCLRLLLYAKCFQLTLAIAPRSLRVVNAGAPLLCATAVITSWILFKE